MAGGFQGLNELSGVWLSGPPASALTRQERFSFMAFGGDGTHIHVTQEVDSAVAAADRATLLDLYCGIALGAPVAVVGGAKYIPTIRRRRRR